MQTFVPYGSHFAANAQVLDRQRLGKQRVEAWQIIKALTEVQYGWKNHPAVKMWQGHTEALAMYGIAMCQEWISRGYADSLLDRFLPFTPAMQADYPEWLDSQEVMTSHRSNLIRKLPDHYGIIWPDIPNNLPYVWPLRKDV